MNIIFRSNEQHIIHVDQELISCHNSSCCCCSSCGGPFHKSLRLRRFKSRLDELWQDCSSSKYASIDKVGLLIRRHTFKMAAMTSFHAVMPPGKYIRKSAARLCSNVRQFLIHSIFVLVSTRPRESQNYPYREQRYSHAYTARLVEM